MKTSTITITDRDAASRARQLPGWMWFVILWIGGVTSAVTLGYVFKIFMNFTLFAVK
ncbi:conserved protein of unknown function [Burkholderia multivorans]